MSVNIDYTITYTTATSTQSAAQMQTPLFVAPMQGIQLMQASGSESDALLFNEAGVAEVTIHRTSAPELGDWCFLASNLPAYDASGHPYYYWVEEVEVDDVEVANSSYTPAYRFTDAEDSTTYCIDAANAGADPTAEIQNTKKEASVVMPSTGGKGTRGYTITGLAILLIGSAVSFLIKRRSKEHV